MPAHPDDPAELEETRRLFEDSFRALLEPLAEDPEKRAVIAARLADMRKHATERHDYYERYRTQYLAVGLAMLPLSFAIGIFLLNYVHTAGLALPRAAVEGLGVVSFVATGLAVVFSYIEGTSVNYSYRGVARTWSWYHGSLGLVGTGDADRLSPKHRREDRTAFAHALRQFGADWIAFMGAPWHPLAEDIEQVFILYVLQGVKRRQVQSLSIMVKWGITVGVALLLIGLVLLGVSTGSVPKV